MRRRRQMERTRGRSSLRGTFDHVLAEAAAEGVPPRVISSLLSSSAHPPGDHRAPDRDRSASPCSRNIAASISSCASSRCRAGRERERNGPDRRLARSDRARVDDRRAAFAEADRAARGVERPPFLRRELVREGAGDALPARRRARAILPGHAFRASRPSSSSARGSAATATGTRRSPRRSRGWTLRQNALASLRHYRERIEGLAKLLSITERALPVPAGFRAELARELDASGEGEAIAARNPGEPYRQYLSLVLRKLDATLARVQGMEIGGPGAAYANADELILDLRTIENALIEAHSASIAQESGEARAPRRRDLPLLNGEARPPREHDAHHGGAAILVVGDGWPRRRDAAGAWQPRVALLAVARARPPAHRAQARSGACRQRPQS